MRTEVKTALVCACAGAAGAFALRSLVRERRWMPLDGRTALVTGGSRGLGLVIARELARKGARLAVCARDAAELERAAADLASEGTRALAAGSRRSASSSSSSAPATSSG